MLFGAKLAVDFAGSIAVVVATKEVDTCVHAETSQLGFIRHYAAVSRKGHHAMIGQRPDGASWSQIFS